jgi:hypothetical protein
MLFEGFVSSTTALILCVKTIHCTRKIIIIIIIISIIIIIIIINIKDLTL